MQIDLEQNLQYYKSEQSVPCDCAFCKNYYIQIKEKYPDVADFLLSINVDILRPFELMWVENEKDKKIEYVGCQYIVFGTCEDNFKKQIGNVIFEINTTHHPNDEKIKNEHFILDFGKIILDMY